ncbi:MAG: L-2-hydroxyglutarate oxidase [Halodesulfurarchaeum sp.]
MEHQVVVIGGGVVGLSTAKHLAEGTDLDVALVEKESRFAVHQSGRNSGVLHPGFNYDPDSIKADFAVEGTSRLKEYARENDVPLSEFGVVVVAQDDAEEERLHELSAQAAENGVRTEILDPEELAEHEPHATGQAALYAPEAASIDSPQYVHQLARDVQAAGTSVYLGTTVEKLLPGPDGYQLRTDKGPIEASFLVNAAGLHADTLAHQLGVGTEYQIVPFRGEYYEVIPDRRHLVETMIYPTPDPDLPFLGVHFTRRTDGKVIVGPNAVLAFGREAYRNTDFDLDDLKETLTYRGFWRLLSRPKMLSVAVAELNKSYRKERFTRAAQRLVPEVESSDLRRSFAGIRAQVVREDGTLIKDPVFVEESDAIHVLNAVSPGLTASLPFGDHLAERVTAAF